MTRLRRLIRVVLCIVGMCGTLDTATAAAPEHIDYEVTRQHSPLVDRYLVTLRFRGTTEGTTTLILPGRWASAEGAERGIEELKLVTRQARLEDTDKPDVKRIVHRPGQVLTVTYALKQIATGEPSVESRSPYLPVIQPGYFAWIGWTTWVVPRHGEEPLRVTVRFRDLPDDWSFASSFGLDPLHVQFKGSLGRFRSSIFVGGDFRLRAREALGGPIITATRGEWPMRDGAFADRIATIVNGERTFWRDEKQPFFLVVALPLKAQPGMRSYVGTGLTQSFAAFVSAGFPLDDLDALWTHEYFHNWNAIALGRSAEPETDLYWFSEGFTDYYTSLLQLRWGMLTLDRYAKLYDEKLKTLAESPVNQLANKDIAATFFTNRSVGQLPYLRGQFLAMQWDARIRASSNGRRSLDDLMRSLRDQHDRGAALLDVPRIVALAKAEGVADPQGDVERQIDRGELPHLEDGEITSCIAIGEVTEPRFDWGFDLDGSIGHGGPIVGIKVDGPAYAAGMRDTQFLRSAPGRGPADRLVEVGVEDAGQNEIRLLRYYPVGAALTHQTATIKPDLTEAREANCLQALGAPPPPEVPSRLPSMAPP